MIALRVLWTVIRCWFDRDEGLMDSRHRHKLISYPVINVLIIPIIISFTMLIMLSLVSNKDEL